MRLLTLLIPLMAATALMAQAPACDIPFVSREGDSTSVLAVARSLAPGTPVNVLLFDPDCGECHVKIDSLMADGALADSIARGQTAMIALYAAFGTPEADDPNYRKYLDLCGSLPASWIVGCDNGATIDTEAYPLDAGPFLARFNAPCPVSPAPCHDAAGPCCSRKCDTPCDPTP